MKITSLEVVLHSTWMAMNDGGATPKKVPIQKGGSRTPITGDTMLMNQLGRNGVILKNTM